MGADPADETMPRRDIARPAKPFPAVLFCPLLRLRTRAADDAGQLPPQGLD